MVSFDVSALFTSVPVEESLKIIQDKLTLDTSLSGRTKLSPQQVTELLRLCLTTTYFKYDGKFYSQVEGAAMGSPVSPIVANLFMEWFESRALATFPSPPKVWVRYVNDAGAVMKSSLIEPFHRHLNSIHPNIKFTKELEENGSLPMLDVLMSRKEDGWLKFSVFRKSTHTDQYLQFDSHQPMEHKMGVIRTLRHRADHIITEDEDRAIEYEHLRTVLSVAGYTKWAWQSPGRTKVTPHPRTHTDSRPKSHVTLPYVAGVTEAITRKIRKTGVAVHSTPHTTIRRLLVAPKDKDKPDDTCGVVYHLTCEDCDAQYVGETERALKKRISEHKRDSSPVAQHMQTYKHQPTKKVTILDRESRWFERGVKEAVHIRSRSPSLNRDQGRHRLPPIYNSLVQSRDLGDL
ncbi:Hypp6981 [Branchiostoma lanceolatum]|uniref:Hypp6981 protein n=1 Tax=Branchiostoma lanceolatum TaxID=7740 RepID=A0A8K0E5L9_BRALA|nr:Hypp6981 [Branchiostoma lanceolatum]